MVKRFLTYFGISIPPWRDRKLGAGAITIRFVICGRVPSKKNNQQAVCVRKEAYKYLDDIYAAGRVPTKDQVKKAIRLVRGKMRGNDEYRAFLETQKEIIEAQRRIWFKRLEEKGIIFPLPKAALNIRFYFAQRYRQDSVNKQQSVQDLLKDCMIITDDDYTCVNPITVEADCYADEILHNLTVVSLSFSRP